MGYKFYFDNNYDRNHFTDRVCEIANMYGCVTLQDLYDLLGEKADYLDREYIWLEDTILLNICSGRDGVGRYYVTFPEPDQYPATTRKSYKDYYHNTTPRSAVKPKNTPEPLNITILMDPSKDPYTTIREVIRQANEIKDRPVFITIS